MHSGIATSSISFCISGEGFLTNPWIFVKTAWQLNEHRPLPFSRHFPGKFTFQPKEALEHLLWELDVKQGPAGRTVLMGGPHFFVSQKGKVTMFWGRLNFAGFFLFFGWVEEWSFLLLLLLLLLLLDLKCDFQAVVLRKPWMSPFCLGVGLAKTIYSQNIWQIEKKQTETFESSISKHSQ